MIYYDNSEQIVATGQLAIGQKKGLIRSTPLGSCIAFIAYDIATKIGGMAHIMLPGKSPKDNKIDENKYAEKAIANLLNELNTLGARKMDIEVCLVGGANVLKKDDDIIADNLIFSIYEIIEQRNLTLKETSLGGYERRTVKLCLHSGNVSFTVGDKKEKTLYNFLTGERGAAKHEYNQENKK